MLGGGAVGDEGGAGGQRAVQGGEAEVPGEGLVQGADVAEADEGLGPGGAHRRPVEQVDHPVHAVAAAGADDGVDGGVEPVGLEVGGAVGVGAGQVAERGVGVEDVRGDGDAQAPGAEDRAAGGEAFGFDRAAGGDDGDVVAGAQLRRAGQPLAGSGRVLVHGPGRLSGAGAGGVHGRPRCVRGRP